ncbi:hypothetical protein ASG92_19800 [Arthrobacter sp. Soil736]|uniref:DUF3027 domain-containing protein n=1 Tax=Arthrobacter sp. Soil736 TaxID=1736395 RepID=UPI0006FA8025|nr:DUF3027 domain-containing protein [Arthrobacter sp. Soil736]KRE63262.1 hypothetical protein ASG92_19800 [Arthrobacter sp. Soil736]
MNPEPEQAEAKAESKAPKRRAGVPVWRTGKPDAVLAAAVDVARAAVEGIAKASEIGEHLAARTEGDRVVTHLFESRLPGYGGWQWYAVLTRNSRSKVITVNELGLLPSEDSILAPEWVPWAERVRPEDAREEDVSEDTAPEDSAAEEAASEETAAEDTASEENDAEDTALEENAAAAGGGTPAAADEAVQDEAGDDSDSLPESSGRG